MEQEKAIRSHEVLSQGLECVLTRLDEWFREAPEKEWGEPERGVIPDPTFRLLPASSVPFVVVQFLARLNRCGHAALVLVGADHAVEAQPILRAMIETTIDMRYVATNPQVLATKWVRYENKWRYKQSRTASECDKPKDFGFLERQLDDEVAALNRHRPKRTGKWRRRDLLNDWDASSVRRRDSHAAEVWGDNQSIYGLYSIFSDVQHGNPVGARDHLLEVDGQVVAVPFPHPGRKTATVLLMTLHMLWLALCAAQNMGAPVDSNLANVEMDVGRDELAAIAMAEFQCSVHSS